MHNRNTSKDKKMVLLHEYLAFYTIKIIFRLGQVFLFVRAPGLYEWPCILAMCIFSILFYVFLYSHTVQNKRCYCWCCLWFSSQRIARELVTQNLVTPLLLSNLVPSPRGSRFSKQRGCASCLLQLLAIHICSPRGSPRYFWSETLTK